MPIPPYILGFWLGDGCSDSGTVVIGKQDAKESLEIISSYGYSYKQRKDEICFNIFREKPLLTELKNLGVLKNKHIPDIYLRGSAFQRLELLQGLFDTDGYCAKDGQIEFCNTNENISLGVYELLNSFGVKAFITTKIPTCTNGKNGKVKGAKAWMVRATTTLPVFKLTRKKERLPTTLRETQRWHYVKNVEEVNAVITQCLTVDSPTHTFLVTKSFIPTHNTSSLLGDFLQDVYNFGADWQGVIFRRTYPELEEVIKQAYKFFEGTGGEYFSGTKTWKWLSGATLKLRSLEKKADASKYQGHSYAWIGWDEVTNWKDDEAYKELIACLRGTSKAPRRIRVSGNPGGVGHQWVKQRFKIGEFKNGWELIRDDESGLHRLYIPSRTNDNPSLMKNDPNYINRLRAVGSKELVRAWLEGDWDIVLGAYFDEWDEEKHVIPDVDLFNLPYNMKIYRAYDHGSYHPFCVLWYTVVGKNKFLNLPEGTIIILREWYGGDTSGKGIKKSVDEVALGIKERETEFGRKVEPGPADNQIFEEDGGRPLSDIMASRGVYFTRSDKRRIPGWHQVRYRLQNNLIKFCECCKMTVLTLPNLQHDDTRQEDVDTTGNDHCGDVVRYLSMAWPLNVANIPVTDKMRDIQTYNELIEASEELTKNIRI